MSKFRRAPLGAEGKSLLGSPDGIAPVALRAVGVFGCKEILPGPDGVAPVALRTVVLGRKEKPLRVSAIPRDFRAGRPAAGRFLRQCAPRGGKHVPGAHWSPGTVGWNEGLGCGNPRGIRIGAFTVTSAPLRRKTGMVVSGASAVTVWPPAYSLPVWDSIQVSPSGRYTGRVLRPTPSPARPGCPGQTCTDPPRPRPFRPSGSHRTGGA